MMTSVVACGNGWLSRGLYRGLASEARLVLVKVGSARRIKHDDIRRGLEWVDPQPAALRHPHRERELRRGLRGELPRGRPLAGRRGGDARGPPRRGRGGQPRRQARATRSSRPASAPSVLTVGGLDDKNRLPFSGYDMYHSSYGPTVDGLQKPEVIAPGIWVAAPILPGHADGGAGGAPRAPRRGAGRGAAARSSTQGRRHGRRPRRRRPPRAAARAPARRGEDPGQQRDLGRLQARRRHELRGPDRLVARRADARGEPRPRAAPGEAARRSRRRGGCPTSRWTARAGASSTRARPSRPRARRAGATPKNVRGATGAPRTRPGG